jgi:hypothetical protein
MNDNVIGLDADMGDTSKGYESSRDYAASLSVVPKQHSSGGKQVYLGAANGGTVIYAPC